MTLSVDLDHIPADYAEAIEMLRRLREDRDHGRIPSGLADCAEAVFDCFVGGLQNGVTALEAMQGALRNLEEGLRDVGIVESSRMPAELIDSTESDKHVAFEWLRAVALGELENARDYAVSLGDGMQARAAAIMVSEIARYQDLCQELATTGGMKDLVGPELFVQLEPKVNPLAVESAQVAPGTVVLRRIGQYTQVSACVPFNRPDCQFTYDLVAHLVRQKAFSERAFGPGTRMAGIVEHIRRELAEIEAKPLDVYEWIDVVLLGFDGAWRAGHSPAEIAQALHDKLARNESRTWPDWRTVGEGRPIEHHRSTAEKASHG